jgi:hypothetical protein
MGEDSTLRGLTRFEHGGGMDIGVKMLMLNV